MSVERSTRGTLPIITVTTQSGTSITFSTHGAHLLSWKPKNEHEVFYLSEKAIYSKTKAIRGGVPICWPYFGGVHSPQHGYARISEWKEEIIEFINEMKGHVRMSFILNNEDLDLHLQAFVDITFDEFSLTEALSTVNLRQDKECVITQALHSYFSVGNISTISISGLEDVPFQEKAKSEFIQPHSESPLKISGQVDREYYPVSGELTIHDDVLKRDIKIERIGSNSCIVWNVFEGATQLSDMNDDDYKEYICVEAANILGDQVTIKPGEEHILSFTATVTKH